jgi:hypothetical protein
MRAHLIINGSHASASSTSFSICGVVVVVVVVWCCLETPTGLQELIERHLLFLSTKRL